MDIFFNIIIPTKNRSKTLRHTIQTVLLQEYSNFRIIISDNNSTDDTQKIIKEFDDKRIFKSLRNVKHFISFI